MEYRKFSPEEFDIAWKEAQKLHYLQKKREQEYTTNAYAKILYTIREEYAKLPKGLISFIDFANNAIQIINNDKTKKWSVKLDK